MQCCARSCGWPARRALAALFPLRPQVCAPPWCRFDFAGSLRAAAVHVLLSRVPGNCRCACFARSTSACFALKPSSMSLVPLQPLWPCLVGPRVAYSHHVERALPARDYGCPKGACRTQPGPCRPFCRLPRGLSALPEQAVCPAPPPAAMCVSRSWRAAAEACPDLWRHVNLSWRRCRPSDAALARAAPRWAQLRWLSLSGVAGVSDAGLQVRPPGQPASWPRSPARVEPVRLLCCRPGLGGVDSERHRVWPTYGTALLLSGKALPCSLSGAFAA